MTTSRLIYLQKWMRIDFREERRWKVALAFGLAQSVMAWHEAGTLEERVRRGICVLWKRPQPEQDDTAADRADQDAVEIPDMDDETGPDSRDTNTPANDYGSDDDSDDEQEKEQEQDRRDVFDALAPGTLLAEALADKEAKVDGSGPEHVQFKTEDVEDTSGLRNTLDERADAMDVDSKPAIEDNVEPDSGTKDLENEDPTATALKDSSSDPVLTHHSTDTRASHSSGKARSKAKSTAYAPLREEIIYSAIDKLFIDCDELDLAKGMSELSTDDYLQSLPPPPDLTSIFPDLTPFGLPEPVTSGPSPSGGNEGRRKSDKRTDKDDPNRRVEETAYNKLYPVSDFMHTKPTLLGALHPSKHWHDGEWDNVEEAVIATEFDSPSPRVIEESSCSEYIPKDQGYSISQLYPGLFDGNKSNSPGLPILLLPGIRKDPRSSKRAPEPVWNPTDDAILKRLVEKYPGNWILIADAFNSSRVTISTDRRSPAECYERWLELSGRTSEAHSQDDARSHPAAPATPMTTRGTKRTAAMASSATPVSTTVTNVTVESKRKRRHALLYEAMRKAMKKREANLKANGNVLYRPFIRSVMLTEDITGSSPTQASDDCPRYTRPIQQTAQDDSSGIESCETREGTGCEASDRHGAPPATNTVNCESASINHATGLIRLHLATAEPTGPGTTTTATTAIAASTSCPSAEWPEASQPQSRSADSQPGWHLSAAEGIGNATFHGQRAYIAVEYHAKCSGKHTGSGHAHGTGRATVTSDCPSAGSGPTSAGPCTSWSFECHGRNSCRVHSPVAPVCRSCHHLVPSHTPAIASPATQRGVQRARLKTAVDAAARGHGTGPGRTYQHTAHGGRESGILPSPSTPPHGGAADA